ncbi:MAG: hypothetical protein PUF72_00790 [Clostridiales bacterium]|nr:hypothetical protein [Clostridiales bacterium]
MIYSKDIEQVCALCAFGEPHGEEEIICRRKKPSVHKINDVCRHYKYDIFKRPVHRRKAFSTKLKPEDFEL